MSQVYGKIFKQAPLSPSHIKIIELVGENKEVLELGASTGYLTKEFNKNNCRIDIVEKDPEDALKAKKFANKVYIGSLDESKFLDGIRGKYDVVVAADVIEHLENHQQVLTFVKNAIKKDGIGIISLPNIACWRIRKDLFFDGKFEYQEEGILDKTHLKFFTYHTIQKVLSGVGLKIVQIYQMDTEYPLKNIILKLGKIGRIFNRLIGQQITEAFPNLCTVHMVIKVRNA